MTAKSRVRKIQKKLRRTADVNPQPLGTRSEPADAEAEGRPVAVVLDGQARLQSVSLVREGEGTGYIIEVGEEPRHTLHSVILGDLGIEHEFPEFYPINGNPYEEAVREASASDAATLAEREASGTAGATHQVFFEQEVNGQPTHIESEDCYCSQELHHWKDLGEN